jgi:hypothetical protein
LLADELQEVTSIQVSRAGIYQASKSQIVASRIKNRHLNFKSITHTLCEALIWNPAAEGSEEVGEAVEEEEERVRCRREQRIYTPSRVGVRWGSWQVEPKVQVTNDQTVSLIHPALLLPLSNRSDEFIHCRVGKVPLASMGSYAHGGGQVF